MENSDSIEEISTSPIDSPPMRLAEQGPKTPEGSPPQSIKISNAKKDFEGLIEFYLADNTTHSGINKNGELEVRFGTNPRTGKPLSKIDYEYSCI